MNLFVVIAGQAKQSSSAADFSGLLRRVAPRNEAGASVRAHTQKILKPPFSDIAPAADINKSDQTDTRRIRGAYQRGRLRILDKRVGGRHLLATKTTHCRQGVAPHAGRPERSP
jgi:hypothetical protein